MLSIAHKKTFSIFFGLIFFCIAPLQTNCMQRTRTFVLPLEETVCCIASAAFLINASRMLLTQNNSKLTTKPELTHAYAPREFWWSVAAGLTFLAASLGMPAIKS